MNKNIIKTAVLSLAFAIMAGWIAYTEGVKLYQAERNKAIQSGALQMREAIFSAVSQSEAKISNARGDKTITIMVKPERSPVVDKNTDTMEQIRGSEE
jgi:hypothetical protein